MQAIGKFGMLITLDKAFLEWYGFIDEPKFPCEFGEYCEWIKARGWKIL
jgi:hypothetical protein